MLTDYRVRIAYDSRDWTAALRLQQTLVDNARQEAVTAVATAPDRRTDADRNHIRTLSIAEEALGHILRQQRDPGCVIHYEHAADLHRTIGDRRAEGVVAFNLGHAYVDIPSLRDLKRAEHWYRRTLALTDEQDRVVRSGTVGQLGMVAHERFRDARAAGQPKQVLLEHLNAAADTYQQALDLLPADANPNLAAFHHQLGSIYTDAGQFDTALTHYQQSIRLKEVAGNRYSAGQTRQNVAVLFARTGRTSDALLYARAALSDYAPYGAGATAAIEQVQQLIALLDPPADPTPTGAP